MSYAGVKRLAKERPDWIAIIKECFICAQTYKEFAGKWVLNSLEEKTQKRWWVPGLRTLRAYGILERTNTSRGGRRTYYVMPDLEGTKKALQELGVLKPEKILTNGHLKNSS